MRAATVSSDYRIVIPKDIRKALGIRPGQKLQALLYDGRIQLIPIKPMKEMRGSLRGIDTTVEREDDRV